MSTVLHCQNTKTNLNFLLYNCGTYPLKMLSTTLILSVMMHTITIDDLTSYSRVSIRYILPKFSPFEDRWSTLCSWLGPKSATDTQLLWALFKCCTEVGTDLSTIVMRAGLLFCGRGCSIGGVDYRHCSEPSQCSLIRICCLQYRFRKNWCRGGGTGLKINIEGTPQKEFYPPDGPL